MIAANDEHINSAARSMFKREVDESTLRLCRKLEWEIAAEERRNKRLAELEAKTADQAATINNLQTENANQAATIDQLRKEIAALKGQ